MVVARLLLSLFEFACAVGEIVAVNTLLVVVERENMFAVAIAASEDHAESGVGCDLLSHCLSPSSLNCLDSSSLPDVTTYVKSLWVASQKLVWYTISKEMEVPK